MVEEVAKILVLTGICDPHSMVQKIIILLLGHLYFMCPLHFLVRTSQFRSRLDRGSVFFLFRRFEPMCS